MQTQIDENVIAGTGTPRRSFSLAKKEEKMMPRSRANACVWRELAQRMLWSGRQRRKALGLTLIDSRDGCERHRGDREYVKADCASAVVCEKRQQGRTLRAEAALTRRLVQNRQERARRAGRDLLKVGQDEEERDEENDGGAARRNVSLGPSCCEARTSPCADNRSEDHGAGRVQGRVWQLVHLRMCERGAAACRRQTHHVRDAVDADQTAGGERVSRVWHASSRTRRTRCSAAGPGSTPRRRASPSS